MDHHAAPEFQRSFELADYLICECRERGELLTPLKLQKLMFYADAWHLALYGAEVTDERFEAWIHGPVAVSQYRRFKDYRWRPITEAIRKPVFEPSLGSHLSEIVSVFGSESAVALEIMTHSERPWLEARGSTPVDQPCNAIISKDVTREFYGSLGKDTEKSAA